VRSISPVMFQSGVSSVISWMPAIDRINSN
jgi:hypothetical protein